MEFDENMSYTQCKPHIFRNVGYLTAQRVSEILSSIRVFGKKVKDQSHLSVEFGDWGKTYPLPPLRAGKSFVFKGLMAVRGGQFPIRFLKQQNLKFFRRVFDEISPWSNIHFHIPLKLQNSRISDLQASLSFELRTAYFGFGFLYKEYEPDDEIMATAKEVQELIALAKLPLKLTAKPKHFLLSKTDKRVKIFRPRRDNDEIPGNIQCTLPNTTLAEILSRFWEFTRNPAFSAGDGDWSLGFLPFDFPKPKDPIKLYNSINQVGFPGNRSRAIIKWHLKDYTCFKDMPLMAKLKKEEVVQTLLDFEFDGRRQCNLDVMCVAQNKFKLHFSLDKEEDVKPLAERLKLRLELY